MIQGLYAAATGMNNGLLNQQVTADNLANANTPGFRRQGVAFGIFQGVLDQETTPAPGSTLYGSAPLQGFSDLRPGPLQYTGNPLDLAVTGDGYFVIEGPGGQVLTRTGTFRLNDLGEFVNAIGQRLRGEGGPLQIPPNTTRIEVSLEGVVLADGAQVGRLQIVRVTNPATALQRVGGTVFQGPTQPGQQELGDIRVLQGYREGSNVQPVAEMVLLLTNMRYYEASQRVVKTLNDALSQNTRPQQA